MDVVAAYHSNAKLKSDFLAEISLHEQADALVKGDYGQFNGVFRGCGIGCSVFSLHRLQGKTPTKADRVEFRDHRKVAADLGWPLWLAHLEDDLFERLPNDLSKTWPRRLADAIPVGAVITDAVLAKILVWSLTAETYGVIHATDTPDVKGWITTIAEAITADANGTIMADQREAAARAAMAARAGWDARDARDARAAWAAWDAWDAWDARDATIRDQFYPALSEYVLSVLRELPIKVDASGAM